ncbi:MAG: hypothetical protein M5U14_18535 [Acidimicrobiia bacterium]|nr:hypothetical protein [Acidimicrobiia bacterium]
MGLHAGRSGPGGERGSAAVALLAILALGIALALGAARLAAVTVAKARAEAAADAAALAGADALALGRGHPAAVAAARETAEANGARLVWCSCRGLEAEVLVELTEVVTRRDVRARARAEVVPACLVGGCEPG